MDLKSKIILISGPTASGKSNFADNLAKKIKGEIINADSMQVYKEIKILSARPNDKSIKHHLYGFISVKKNFSTGSWYKLAAKKIKDIILYGSDEDEIKFNYDDGYEKYSHKKTFEGVINNREKP